MSDLAERSKVKDVMTRGCRCADVTDTVRTISEAMAEEGIGAMPICGNDDKLHGMITDRDIVVKCLAQGMDPDACTAGELATDQVIWVNENSSSDEAMAQMEEHQVRRLIVLDDDKRLAGIVSIHDLAQKLDEEDVGEVVHEIMRGEPRQAPA